jgi:hypothetical protein
VATRSLFWFEGATPTAPLKSATRITAARSAPQLRLVHAAPPARPARVLSQSQREALNALIGLGAKLDDGFTLQELRSQFRALARPTTRIGIRERGGKRSTTSRARSSRCAAPMKF